MIEWSGSLVFVIVAFVFVFFAWAVSSDCQAIDACEQHGERFLRRSEIRFGYESGRHHVLCAKSDGTVVQR